ncbi:MAG TPA: ComEC/Rec2 family competence protein [Blastocatellia bacterium]|nr:ComEC/Rec2 family competence protein [Blastocatellia bacterium]
MNAVRGEPQAEEKTAASARPRACESNLSMRRQPFFYLAVALTIGILVDRWCAPARALVSIIASASIIASIKFVIARRSAAASVALLASFAALGALLSFNQRTDTNATRLKQLYDAQITANDPVELTGVMVAPPEPAPELYYLDIAAESIRARDDTIAATGRVRLMVSLASDEAKDEFNDLHLDYGSRVRMLVRLERARAFNNPGSPDFNEFLERRGYDFKGTIKSPLLIERAGRASVNGLLAALYHLRLRMMTAIDSAFNARVAGTMKAMLTGNRYFLDRETSERLRESATFHTLVIAGLHIGIIAWALLRIPVTINDWRRRRSKTTRAGITRTAVALFVLWAYAVMVGLAAPVTRATVMITIGLIGPLLFRRAASINTVSLAAFTMLALEPALVADSGFQLSFIAVAAIVALALPLIDKLRAIGEWRPSADTPHPPSCSPAVRSFAETIFWDERAFNKEMRRAAVRYHLIKSRAARGLGLLRLQWLARGVVTLVITSTAIQLATLPLMAIYFNRAAPVGVLLNIFAGLLTAILMIVCIATITVGAVASGIAAPLRSIVVAAHHLLINAIVPFLTVPGATFRVANYEGWQSIIYAAYFAPLVLLAILIDRWHPLDDAATRGRGDAAEERGDAVEVRVLSKGERVLPASRRLRVSASFACALAIGIAAVGVVRPASVAATGKLTVHFLDVGQGDAALVVFPRGSTMLVDAGGEIRFNARDSDNNLKKQSDNDESEADFNDDAFSIGEAVVSRFLWSQGRTRVDYLLVTHADADHIGGFADVIKNFQIGQAIVGHAPTADAEFDLFARSLARRGVPLATVSAGERFELEGVSIEVLWPQRAAQFPITSSNNDSVVVRLSYGSVSIMLAGDIEEASERAIIESGANLRSDVLKVPHHGSKTSSTESFINAVAPRCAVISVGERSRFGHPNREVVDRYLARGVRLFQTGRDGTVTVETDGVTLAVGTYKSNP